MNPSPSSPVKILNERRLRDDLTPLRNTLQEIADVHKTSMAQVAMSWCREKGTYLLWDVARKIMQKTVWHLCPWI